MCYTSGLLQGIQHGRNPDVKTLPLHALGMIIEREKSRRRILGGHPLERRLPRTGERLPPDKGAEGGSLLTL